MTLRSDAKTVEHYCDLMRTRAYRLPLEQTEFDAIQRLARRFALERPVAVVLTTKWQSGYAMIRGITRQIEACLLDPSGKCCWRPVFNLGGKIEDVEMFTTAADAWTAHQCDLIDECERKWQAAEARKLELGHGGGNDAV